MRRTKRLARRPKISAVGDARSFNPASAAVEASGLHALEAELFAKLKAFQLASKDRAAGKWSREEEFRRRGKCFRNFPPRAGFSSG